MKGPGGFRPGGKIGKGSKKIEFNLKAKSYWELLGIPENADQPTIERASKELFRKFDVGNRVLSGIPRDQAIKERGYVQEAKDEMIKKVKGKIHSTSPSWLAISAPAPTGPTGGTGSTTSLAPAPGVSTLGASIATPFIPKKILTPPTSFDSFKIGGSHENIESLSPWERLGIRKDASKEQVESAFRKLTMGYSAGWQKSELPETEEARIYRLLLEARNAALEEAERDIELDPANPEIFEDAPDGKMIKEATERIAGNVKNYVAYIKELEQRGIEKPEHLFFNEKVKKQIRRKLEMAIKNSPVYFQKYVDEWRQATPGLSELVKEMAYDDDLKKTWKKLITEQLDKRDGSYERYREKWKDVGIDTDRIWKS